MENCKGILKKANIVPDLKLFTKLEGGGTQTTGPHKVKLLGDKIVKGLEYLTGKEIYLIRLLLEENGEQKKYDFPMKDKKGDVHYMVQRLAEFGEGSEIILEGMSQGGRSFTNVQAVNSVSESSNDDIPVIQQDEEIPTVEDDPTLASEDLALEETQVTEKKEKVDEDEIDVENIPFS